MRIKICGITQTKDALKAEKIGFNAIGVIVKTDSPRNIPLKKARKIFNQLGPYITKVCVTTTKSQKKIQEILQLNPDALQLYTDPNKLRIPKNTAIIQAIEENEINKLEPSQQTDALLIDSSRGQGIQIDIKAIKNKIKNLKYPTIVSGGLNPTNIEKIQALDIYGVDVSSGVEETPGIKNHIKMKDFHKKLRCQIE
ncbi:phosphoribosylanthranilate isomerase [Methanonatronarchaeum sp. AMET-Sl]|uniref:phosphoribosylanthranilate isomerase n=1 Tax=Methanonatronarchaeum sp. AMET-Sl TaxID=3037654 RepID=UPI00244DFE3F|nr:phosphoribosylanthranilate isomerase [Methanonatronarchaeum sp. AMET-Sl]WGI16802.1 phosphoribosylanthranilate isomerase [Methanonatronarchaeum sp. AMET-Sl]